MKNQGRLGAALVRSVLMIGEPDMAKSTSKWQIDPYYDSPDWRNLRSIVCTRDRNICQYCGAIGYQADHVIPRKHHGADHETNLVCCCATCNRTACNTKFTSFDHKKKWILVARGILKPDIRPALPKRPRPQAYPVRKPPHRGTLREKLAIKNNPSAIEEEAFLFKKSQS